MNRRQTIGSVMTAAAMVSAHAAAQECGEYQVTAIVQAAECPPFGYPPTSPRGINEQGWMVGTIQSCVIGPDVAMLWTPEDGLMVIPMPPGTSYSAAAAISGSLIVGAYDNPDLELGRTGFLYDFETDQFTSLGTLPGGNWSEARDINSAGQITGFWGNNVIGFWNAFIWEDGKMIDLGPSIGGADSRALGINENGAITGWWRRKDGDERIAFVWDDGTVNSLGPIPDGFSSEGWSLNCRGDVVGRGKYFDPRLNDEVWRAFVFVNGESFRLDPLPGPSHSNARDVNNAQTVVGSSNLRAFIWQDGLLTDLNDLVPFNLNLTFTSARSINEAGQIAARAVDAGNDVVAVLLTPLTGLPGDLNGDCTVGASDLLILLASWGPCKGCPGDLDDDGSVGASDLLILLSNWG